MAKKLFLLSGECTDIAEAEIASLFGKIQKISDRVVTAYAASSELPRLAYTRMAIQLIFKTKPGKLKEKIKSYDWNKIYKENFCVRALNLSARQAPKASDLADLIWRKLKKPKAELTNPKTLIEFIFVNSDVYCGLVLFSNEESFSSRRPHLRPEFSPISLSPKLARAMVNLTGIKKSNVPACHPILRPGDARHDEILLDPFCGTGGVLIEAGLMGFRTLGYDIDEIGLRKAAINLEHYKIRNYLLRQHDSTTPWPDKNVRYVVADLPYGRSAKLSDEMTILYSAFLKNLKKMKVKRAVVTFPNYFDYRPLIKKSKLKIIRELSYYIHASLTKKILIIK